MGKTPVPSRLQIYKLMAVIFMAINCIETVNFSCITALYRYTGRQSIISLFWVQYHTKHMKIIYFFYCKLMKLVAKLWLPIIAPKSGKLQHKYNFLMQIKSLLVKFLSFLWAPIIEWDDSHRFNCLCIIFIF